MLGAKCCNSKVQLCTVSYRHSKMCQKREWKPAMTSHPPVTKNICYSCRGRGTKLSNTVGQLIKSIVTLLLKKGMSTAEPPSVNE